ncbi:MAG: DUF4252 domain-containing protein [Flammeovirgaceae bacterium]|nr:DUF4252 domain-containing protein [Flammeovirgaceae bacterium]
MKLVKWIFCLMLVPTLVSAQTETTNSLQEKYEGSFTLFFYNNTLKMLNQQDNADFDILVKDIEKMKFLMINKEDKGFGNTEYKSLVKGYEGESYESIMTSRFDGRNFDMFMREKNGDVKGTVILVNDSTNLYVLDILGKIPLEKAGSLFEILDENQISKFMKGGTNRKGKEN